MVNGEKKGKIMLDKEVYQCHMMFSFPASVYRHSHTKFGSTNPNMLLPHPSSTMWDMVPTPSVKARLWSRDTPSCSYHAWLQYLQGWWHLTRQLCHCSVPISKEHRGHNGKCILCTASIPAPRSSLAPEVVMGFGLARRGTTKPTTGPSTSAGWGPPG